MPGVQALLEAAEALANDAQALLGAVAALENAARQRPEKRSNAAAANDHDQYDNQTIGGGGSTERTQSFWEDR